jgi:lysophospholipase
VQRFEDYLADVEAARTELNRRARSSLGEDLPLLLVSHSHGGLVALRLLSDLERCPAQVRAAVLSSPFLGLKLQISPLKRMVARIAGAALPTLSMPNQLLPEQLTSDPAKQAERRVDTLCHDVASARWYTEVLTTWARVRTFASRIQVPTLWLVAGDDEVVDPKATLAMKELLRVPASFHVLENFKHEVFNELDRANAFAMVRAFVAEQFPKR